MKRWFLHDPQAQEGFLNLGYHFFIKDSEAPGICLGGALLGIQARAAATSVPKGKNHPLPEGADLS